MVALARIEMNATAFFDAAVPGVDAGNVEYEGDRERLAPRRN
jgi:hypothetical protein